jgi:hypothetical protein
VACETRTSPGFTFDNESGCFSFDTPQCGPILRFALSRSARDALTDPIHGGETDMRSMIGP